MIIADGEPSMLIFRLVGIGAILVIVVGPILAITLKRRGDRRLTAIIAEAANDVDADEPVVQVRFHTYHGLLAFAVQTTHELRLPLSRARRVLDRLHGFNRTWGLLAYGVLVIPVLSYFEHRSQLRSIEQQAMGLARQRNVNPV